MRISESGEHYLEAILEICCLRGSCRNADIAERMNRSRPSVTHALSLLVEGGYVCVNNYEVRLTSKGERVARSTLEKRRFFENLLLRVGVEASSASEEACRMEHCLSDESFKRLTSRVTVRSE